MVYIENIITGLIVFPFIAALLTFPYALYQYNRHGSVSKLRTLIIFSFILYMIIAFFMVSLPLPDPESTVGNRWQDHLNLIPFRQIWLYWRNREITLATIREYLTSMSLWQLLFNILLTVPFGIYLRYYFKQSLGRTILFSFLLSLFYEVSQFTALFGIYPGPYRLADVEDLICNTLGGVLGYQIAYVFAMVLPSRDAIDAYCRAEGKKVTGMRRFWSVLFDYIFSEIVFLFLCGTAIVLWPHLEQNAVYQQINAGSFFCAASLLQVLLTNGSTLGHSICRMILVSEDGRIASKGQLILRYLSLWMFTEFPLVLSGLHANGKAVFLPDVVLFALIVFSQFYYVWYAIAVVFGKGRKQMPHEKLSRTVYIAVPVPEESGQNSDSGNHKPDSENNNSSAEIKKA